MKRIVAKNNPTNTLGILIEHDSNNLFTIINPSEVAVSSKLNYFITFNTKLIQDALVYNTCCLVRGGDTIDFSSLSKFYSSLESNVGSLLPIMDQDDKKALYEKILRYSKPEDDTKKLDGVVLYLERASTNEFDNDQVVLGNLDYESICNGKPIPNDFISDDKATV